MRLQNPISAHLPKISFLLLIAFLTVLLPAYTSKHHKNPKTKPMPVYLTWQKDPTTTMTIMWITDSEKTEDNLYYQKIGENDWKTVIGSHVPMPGKLPFQIHKAELTRLEPGTPYAFQIDKGKNTFKFKTMPSKLDQPIRFVVGGDMYQNTRDLEATNKQAAKTNPHFILVGGDIAYGGAKTPGGDKEKDERWLKWVEAWYEDMVTTDGYIIPLLACIGNNDVNGKYRQPKENAPFFYSFFPFPGSQGYNVLDFGSYLSIVSLDSGHTNPISGAQTEWLQQTLEARQKIPNKYVLYHVPAYPSVRKEGKINKLVRRNWSPLFEKYAISAAFENHDHAYKRTHPILNEKVDENGVIYLGDGAWGVTHPRAPKNPQTTWFLANAKQERHFILVTLDNNKQHYQAIKYDGQVIDDFTPAKKNASAPVLQAAGR